MENLKIKTTSDRIGWQADGDLGAVFASMSGNPKCHLCNEGKGEVYRKGHTRRNGIILESSVMYCTSCNDNKPNEVEQDFEIWWKEKWAKQEEVAEKNWLEHGIYTNVGGPVNGLSDFFGYIKLPDGTFKPYRFEHPKDDRDLFDRDMYNLTHDLEKCTDLSDLQKFEALIKYLNECTLKVPGLIERELKNVTEAYATCKKE